MLTKDENGDPAKRCGTCKKTRHVMYFQRDKSNADGYRYQCFRCRSDAAQHYPSKKKKHPDPAVAKEKSKRFFLETGMWDWIADKKKRRAEKWGKFEEDRPKNQTDDILDELGY